MEYEIRTTKGNSFWILATHLQHQTEDKDISDDAREKQAERIAAVYNQLYSEGKSILQ